MPEERPPRKLAVILHADVIGSTMLVQQDEGLAHERIRDTFRRFSDTINVYGGLARELRGDALVAQFDRASDAVCAAVAFQAANSTFNAALSDSIRPKLRIGIAMGEVVIADNTITGEGVVLAQRLEQTTGAGGVCVQGAAYETMPKRLPFDFENLGELSLKGFDVPVRAYTVALKAGEVVPLPEPSGRSDLTGLTLPDKPSIAVLPFTNMSGDPEQAYFSDGITEDIITELSRFRSLFVIARNSSFSFRDEYVNVAEVGRRLGVQYVVEGSVRKAADKVRVNVQLVEVASAHHLWAERYDRELKDIFSVQDEITQSIVATLPGRLEEAGRQGAVRKSTASMTAYDFVLLGLERYNRFTRDQNIKARELFQKAVDIDPQYARAHSLVASTQVWEMMMSSSGHGQLDEAQAGVERALSLDNNDSWTHGILGFVLFIHREDEEAESHFRRAIALNSNDADVAAFMCDFLVYMGRCEEGLEWIAKAKRLNPVPPSWYHWFHALALFSARDYARTIATIKKMRPLLRWGHGYLAASYAYLDRMPEARAEMALFVEASRREFDDQDKSSRGVTLELASERAGRYRNSSDRQHFLHGLRLAGLSD